MKCPFCKGDMKEGKTSLPYEIGERLIVVRNVPALVCEQCGEVFIEMKVAKKVEKIVNSAVTNGISLGFLDYRYTKAA